MKLLAFLVIYGLQGNISSEETTNLPPTGETEEHWPGLEGLALRLSDCDEIKSLNSYASSSGSGSQSPRDERGDENPTTRDENGISIQSTLIGCEAGPSWAYQPAVHQGVSCNTGALWVGLEELVVSLIDQNEFDQPDSQSTISGTENQPADAEIPATREENGISNEIPLIECEAGPSWAYQSTSCQEFSREPDDRNKEQKRRWRCSPRSEFLCEVCGKAFIHKSKLKEHMRSHENDRPYSCRVCYAAFKTKGNLKKHMRTHGPFTCEICRTKSGTTAERNDHVKTHSRGTIFTRELCGEEFRIRVKLGCHEKAHEFRRRYACGDCGKSFKRSGHLKQHMNVHTNHRPFACGICGKNFKRKADLEGHGKIHSSDRRFSCEHCGQTFKREGNWRKHMKTHVEKVKKGPFVCQYCSRSFKTKGYSIRHIHACRDMSGHTHVEEFTDRSFSCKLCTEGFKGIDDLCTHVQGAHDQFFDTQELENEIGCSEPNQLNMLSQLPQTGQETNGGNSFLEVPNNPGGSDEPMREAADPDLEGVSETLSNPELRDRFARAVAAIADQYSCDEMNKLFKASDDKPE